MQRRRFHHGSFHRIFLGVKILAKFLRSGANNIGTHCRRALCGRAVTFATHMLSETVYLFLGDPLSKTLLSETERLDEHMAVRATVASREVETTVFDPASVFLSTH